MKRKIILALIITSFVNLNCLAINHANFLIASGYSGVRGYTSSGGYNTCASNQNNSLPDVSSLNNAQVAQLIDNWVKNNPQKAAELKNIKSSEMLQKWLEANPECIQEFQQMLMSK